MSKIMVEYFDESEVFTIFKNFIPLYINSIENNEYSSEFISYLNNLLIKSKSFKGETDLFQFEVNLRTINLKDNEYNDELYSSVENFINDFYYECDKQLTNEENINVKINQSGKNLKKFKDKN